MEYELIVGLETHVELCTRTKVFCGCPVRFGQPPNTDCCPVCTGMPGTLPVLNREAVRFAVMAGLALGCRINEVSRMSRKHYFYPDLAKAYQITQQEIPLCGSGELILSGGKRIGIQRIHIEEDAGKLIHKDSEILVDYNRGGVPLIEIVTEPDFRSAAQAAEFLERLQEIMRYLGVSDGKMQEGSMRCDVNISVRPLGQTVLGVRTEIKNMNSISYLMKAVEYEYRRQVAELENGREIVRETRRYDERMGVTLPMRRKEGESDYLYFEEPDIPPVRVTPEEIARWRNELPELPEQKRERYRGQWGLSAQDAASLVKYPAVAAYFEEACRCVAQPATAAKWMLSQVFASFPDEASKEACTPRISAREFGKFVSASEQGTLSRPLAKEVLADMLDSGKSLDQALGGKQTGMLEAAALRRLCIQAMEQQPAAVEDYHKGKKQAEKALLGMVMKAAKGRAEPLLARTILEELLKDSFEHS